MFLFPSISGPFKWRQFDSTGDRLVFALLACVPRRRGTAGRAGRARRSRHGVAMDLATGSLRAALIVNDKFLIPVLPRSFDIWAVEYVGELVREAREALNPGLRACIFLNSADARGPYAPEMERRLRWRMKPANSWRVDETYIRPPAHQGPGGRDARVQALLERPAGSGRHRAGSKDHQRPVRSAQELRHGPLTCMV